MCFGTHLNKLEIIFKFFSIGNFCYFKKKCFFIFIPNPTVVTSFFCNLTNHVVDLFSLMNLNMFWSLLWKFTDKYSLLRPLIPGLMYSKSVLLSFWCVLKPRDKNIQIHIYIHTHIYIYIYIYIYIFFFLKLWNTKSHPQSYFLFWGEEEGEPQGVTR